MSTTYAGKKISIVSSTNATPIAIVANAHGYSTGDSVSIAGHLINTNANGEFTIVVTGVNGFTLDSSVGNGVGAGTGTVTSFVGLLTIPADGDVRNAASVNVATEGAADREQLLYQDFKQSLLGLHPIKPSQTLNRIAFSGAYALAANWVPVNAAARWSNLTANTSIFIPVSLPHGSTWTSYSVLYQGAAGHGAFPGGAPGMPYTSPIRMSYITGVESFPGGFIGTNTDGSATAAAYQAVHLITESGGTEVIDNTAYRYGILLNSETGGNFIAGALLYLARCTFTTRLIDIGAS